MKDIVVRSPGRINVIGEHIDYNDGFVLPGCIDLHLTMQISINGTKSKLKMDAKDFDQTVSIHLDRIERQSVSWSNYLIGVIQEFNKLGYDFPGIDVSFSSKIPIGAGLSSSAALETGFAYGLKKLFDLQIDKIELARICQQAESNFVGVQCGIMDQFACLMGRKDHLIFLDCHNLDYELLSFEYEDYQFVLIDSQVRHELTNSEYNQRKKEAEKALEIIRKDGQINSFRQIGTDHLERYKINLTNTLFKRTKHIVSEIERTQLAVEAIKNGNIEHLGSLMYESHQSLDYDYQVCCEETNDLVDLAMASNFCLGARQMGGGFGGCTINLVPTFYMPQFFDFISNGYKNTSSSPMKFYVVQIAQGTSNMSN